MVDNFGPETWRRMIYQERMRRVDDRIFTAFDFPVVAGARQKTGIHYPFASTQSNEQLICG